MSGRLQSAAIGPPSIHRIGVGIEEAIDAGNGGFGPLAEHVIWHDLHSVKRTVELTQDRLTVGIHLLDTTYDNDEARLA